MFSLISCFRDNSSPLDAPSCSMRFAHQAGPTPQTLHGSGQPFPEAPEPVRSLRLKIGLHDVFQLRPRGPPSQNGTRRMDHIPLQGQREWVAVSHSVLKIENQSGQSPEGLFSQSRPANGILMRASKPAAIRISSGLYRLNRGPSIS